MDWFTNLFLTNPWIAIAGMFAFVLGGIIQILIPISNRWGLFGDKTPTNTDLMEQIQLISGNHLSHLPDTERTIEKMDAKLDKMNDTLVEIKTILTRK